MSTLQKRYSGQSSIMAGCLLFAVALLLAGNVSFAQTSGIQGTITDDSLAVIPGAEITVTHVATSVSRTTVSNDVGYYSALLLKEGHYEIKCALSGFSTQETELTLRVGQVVKQDFQLAVGQVSEVIEVTSVSAALQSKTTDVGQVIDERRVRELPLNGRNYLSLAQLSAGVVRSGQAGRGHRGTEEGAFQAAGIHIAQNNILLDGVDNSSRMSTIFVSPLTYEVQAVKPSVDAVAEFKVITNNVSAEYGYRMGAKVLVSTKSGSNDFHGSLFHYYRGHTMGANNFFFNRRGQDKPQFIRNQFGGTVGGPIIASKTFFFFSYEGSRLRKGFSGSPATVPSREMRMGDFSLEAPGFRDIYDPLTLVGTGSGATRSQFPNNRIPQGRFDPVGAKMLDFYPLPNIPGREHLPLNYFISPGQVDDGDGYDVRIDHNFNDNHRIFGRWSARERSNLEPSRVPPPAFSNSGLLLALEAQNLALNYSATLSSNILNEFRFGFSRMPSAFDLADPTAPSNASVGLAGTPEPDEAGTALFAITKNRRSSGFGLSTLGPPGDTPKTDNLRGYHISENVFWDKGNHSLKFGFEYRQMRIAREPAGWRRGWGAFNGFYTSEEPNSGVSRGTTGNAAADFLLGMGWGEVIGTPTGEVTRTPYYGLYVQDDWRITPKLTLNLGLRWELFDGPYYPGGAAAQPQVARLNWSGDITDETAPQLPIEFTGYDFPKDGGDCGCERDTDNFAPRVGLAYRLTDTTVIRAGAGFFFGEADSAGFEAGRFQEGPPNAIIEQFNGGSREQPGYTLGGTGLSPVIPADPTVLPRGTIVRVNPRKLPQMYTGQWFLDLQHQLPGNVLITFGYTGSSTSHLSWWRFINNPATPHAFLTRNQRRRTRDELSNIELNYVSNVLNANYNAFSFRTEKRFSQGLTFLSSFTYSKIIDYGREIGESGTEGPGTVTNYTKDLFRNRGRSNLDRTLNYNLSFLYELPAGPGRGRFESGPASWVLGGWQVGGILSLLSGTPLTHNLNPDTQNTGGRFAGDLVAELNLPSSQRTVDRWFNINAVVPTQQPGTFGNAGRALIEAPGWSNFDFTASKNFYLPMEGHFIQLRFESFNFTNTPHFGKPDVGLGPSPTAGMILRADDARTIQFALKYVF